MSYKFAVLGGDNRNIFLSRKLRDDGALVKAFGMNLYNGEKIEESKSLKEALEDVGYVVGSTPCSNDKENLNAPYSDTLINMEEIFKNMTQEQIFFAGRISENVQEIADKYRIKTYDLLKREDMAILNAIPTAEGAIKIAIEETDITLHNSSVMVLGYGRIGKVLCHMLSGFSPSIHVIVHREEQLAEVKSLGYRGLMGKDMDNKLMRMDLIINTVPKVLLNKTNLFLIKKSCFILDLASKPFGIDYECSKQLGLKVLWAPSLPGKIAPDTVAGYIKQTIYGIIEKEERKCL